MAVKDDVALLKRIPLFAKIDESRLNVLAFSTERVNLRKDEILYRNGEPGSAAFVVVDGEIAIRRTAKNDEPAEIVAGPGSLIGEQSMFAGLAYRGTATAQTPVVALKISKELFYRVAEEFPDLASEAMRTVSEKLDATLADLRLVQRHL